MSHSDDQRETTQHYVVVKGKKVPYTIRRIDDGNAHVRCDAADLSQKTDTQSFFNFITRLPAAILAARKVRRVPGRNIITLRLTDDDKAFIEQQTRENGYPTVSSYLRFLALGDMGKTRSYRYKGSFYET